MLNNIKIYYPNTKNLIFILIVTLCLQFTDVKIFNIKIAEIILLVFFICIPLKRLKINKYIFYFFVFFLLLLIKTLLQNSFTQFYINASLPLLKQPYFISLSRFIEYFCCIIFAYFVVFFFQRMPIVRVLELLNATIKVQIYIVGFFLFVFYALYRVHLLHFNGPEGFMVYDPTSYYGEMSYRVRGLYNEGGPLGLYYAYLFTLYDWVLVQRNRKDMFGKFIIILIIFLAASKAGGSLLVVFLSVKAYSSISTNKYAIILKTIVLPLVLAGTLFFLYYLASNYITKAMVDEVVITDISDTNNVMGRVSGMTIAPNIISHNYMCGIGLGNYPLVRNNPLYRTYFPEVPVDNWDSAGLGGLIDLLMDGGIIFFLSFILIFYKLYKEVKKADKKLLPLMISFILPFFLGVQLYFLYPWLSLGIIVFFLQKKHEEETVSDKISMV